MGHTDRTEALNSSISMIVHLSPEESRSIHKVLVITKRLSQHLRKNEKSMWEFYWLYRDGFGFFFAFVFNQAQPHLTGAPSPLTHADL